MSTSETKQKSFFTIFNYFPRCRDKKYLITLNIVSASFLAAQLCRVNIIYPVVFFVQLNGMFFFVFSFWVVSDTSGQLFLRQQQLKAQSPPCPGIAHWKRAHSWIIKSNSRARCKVRIHKAFCAWSLRLQALRTEMMRSVSWSSRSTRYCSPVKPPLISGIQIQLPPRLSTPVLHTPLSKFLLALMPLFLLLFDQQPCPSPLSIQTIRPPKK